MGSLEGKTAIITGAGRGLGREEALQLASQGANVVISDIDLPDAKAAGEETVEDIKAAGGNATLVLGDCADTEASANLFKTALDTYGDVNIMVNNAGFCRDQTVSVWTTTSLIRLCACTCAVISSICATPPSTGAARPRPVKKFTVA